MLARITVVKAVAFSDSADQLMVGAASFPLVVAGQVDGRHTGEEKNCSMSSTLWVKQNAFVSHWGREDAKTVRG